MPQHTAAGNGTADPLPVFDHKTASFMDGIDIDRGVSLPNWLVVIARVVSHFDLPADDQRELPDACFLWDDVQTGYRTKGLEINILILTKIEIEFSEEPSLRITMS
jgi:hypothetical protein